MSDNHRPPANLVVDTTGTGTGFIRSRSIMQALHLNNQGVSYLQQHDDRLAMICFSKSIKILKQARIWTENKQKSGRSDEGRSCTSAVGPTPPQLRFEQEYGQYRWQDGCSSASCCRQLCSSYIPGVQDRSCLRRGDDDGSSASRTSELGPCYVVPYAFKFSTNSSVASGTATPAAVSTACLQSLCAYGSCVVWNIALLYHYRVRQYANTDPSARQKAFRMYDVVHKCLQSSAEHLPPAISRMLRICTLNNMAELVGTASVMDVIATPTAGDTRTPAVPFSAMAFRTIAALFGQGTQFMKATIGSDAVYGIAQNVNRVGQMLSQSAAAA